MVDDDQPSLEYIEDPYFPKLPNTATPSLDEEYTEFDSRSLYFNDDLIDGHAPEWSPETELYLRSMPLEQIFCITEDHHDLQKVEAELLGSKFADDNESNNNLPNGGSSATASKTTLLWRKLFFSKKSMRDVRVTFIDFSKPYLAKISSSDNYKNFLNIGDGSEKLSDNSPGAASVNSFGSVEFANEFNGLSVEEQDRLRAEWTQELARVEEEITTLRTVLTSKMRHASELKRKLGITVWKEISDDVNYGLKTVKESTVYQKTESALKTTAEKTTSIFGGITSGISSKITQMKKSDSYRSIEDKVGNAYENVKGKVSTSRSGSISSFDDPNLDIRSNTAPQSPTIPENKPLP